MLLAFLLHYVVPSALLFNFFSPTIDHFSPSQTCFLHFQAQGMYLSFGATLAPIGICYRTVWYGGGAPIINEGVLCLGARNKHRFA